MKSILQFVTNRVNLIIFGSCALAIILSSITCYWVGRRDGKDLCVSKNQEKVIEYVKKDAQDWANRPRTDSASIKRLRDAADARRKDNP